MTLYEESLGLLGVKKEQLDPDNYNIVYMGDSWVDKNNMPNYSYTSNEIFTAALNEAGKHNPLMVIHGGDIVYTGNKDLLENFAVQKNALIPDIPLFVAIGNHEMEPTPSGPWSVQNYLDVIGPLHFSLNIPEFQFTLIVLNTLYKFVYNEYGLTDEELEFLRQSLGGGLSNTFVAAHVPPRSHKWPDPDHSFVKGSVPFLDEMKGKVSRALVSHIHAFNTVEIKDTYFILSGCAGAPPNVWELNHIVVINIRKDGNKSRIHYKKIPVGRT